MYLKVGKIDSGASQGCYLVCSGVDGCCPELGIGGGEKLAWGGAGGTGGCIWSKVLLWFKEKD